MVFLHRLLQKKVSKMERIIACCGLVCSECPAFIAAKADGPEDLEAVAAQWRNDYTPGVTAGDVYCQGCPDGSGRKCAHCAEC